MQLWFCEIRGATVGPVSIEQLSALASTGEVTPSTKVRKSEEESWGVASDIDGLFGADDARTSGLSDDANKVDHPRCPDCGRNLNANVQRCQYCGFDAAADEVDRKNSVAEKDQAPADLEPPIETLGGFYAAPFERFGRFLNRLDWLDTFKKVAYAVGGLFAIGAVLLFVDLVAQTAFSLYLLIALVALLGLAIGLLIHVALEWILVGMGLTLVKHPYPRPEKSLRAAFEVVLSRLMIGLLFGLGAIIVLPVLIGQRSSDVQAAIMTWIVIGSYAIQCILYFLIPISIYSQRLSMPAVKATLLSLLSLIVFGGLGTAYMLIQAGLAN